MNATHNAFLGRVRIVLVLLVTLGWLLPIYWLVNVALKTQAQLFVPEPTFVFTPTFSNFHTAIYEYDILWNALNSLIIASASTALTLFFALLFVYGITRFEFRFNNPLLIWILNLRMLPPIAIVIPFYVFYSKIGLIDSYTGMVWPISRSSCRWQSGCSTASPRRSRAPSTRPH